MNHRSAPGGRQSPSRDLADWLFGEDRWLFAVLVFLHVSLVWAFPFFPTSDGPTHVESANILRLYHGPHGAIFREWLTLDAPLAPNWLGHLILTALLFVAPPTVAERLVVTLIVAGLPLAVRQALKRVDPGAGFLALLAFPFTDTWLLHMGFYNFCLGLPLFFLAASCWLQNRTSPSAGGVMRLSGWAALLYLSHPVPLLMAMGLIAWLIAWFATVEVRRTRYNGVRPGSVFLRSLIRGSASLLAFLPVALLLTVFLGGRRQPLWWRPPVGQLLQDLCRLDVLVSFRPEESIPAIALSLLFAGLAVYGLIVRRAPSDLGDGFALATVLFLVAYLASPVGLFSGQYLTPRLMLFPFFGLMFWFATIPFGRWQRRLVAAAATVVSLGVLALHAGSHRDASVQLEEYVSARDWIQPGTVLLPLHYATPESSPRVDVFVHAAAYVAVSRGAFDLVFYEGMRPRDFPLSFRRGLNPYVELGDNPESVAPCVDLREFTRRTGKTIHYVLTWKQMRRKRDKDCAEVVLDQIRDDYDLLHTSTPRQLLRVWRHKAFGGGSREGTGVP